MAGENNTMSLEISCTSFHPETTLCTCGSEEIKEERKFCPLEACDLKCTCTPSNTSTIIQANTIVKDEDETVKQANTIVKDEHETIKQANTFVKDEHETIKQANTIVKDEETNASLQHFETTLKIQIKVEPQEDHSLSTEKLENMEDMLGGTTTNLVDGRQQLKLGSMEEELTNEEGNNIPCFGE